jgi:hypothetical protein
MKGQFPAARKCYGRPLLFDPREGQTIVRPPGQGDGYWAGAPSVVYDAERARFYLYYRLRKPRPVRGGACFVADSEDGLYFRTIWSSTKDDFGSASVERFSLIRALDGKWLLYASYVDPADSRWRIDVLEADSPSGFEVRHRRKVLTAGDVGVEGVKDPWVMIVNGLYVMLISYAVRLPVEAAEHERMHATGDIYNTGLTLSSSALAVSGDGRHYEWVGDMFSPRPGAWDGYASRLGCLLPTAHGWLGYYDGSASVEENYEERTGLVQSLDLRHFYRLSATGPSLVSPHGRGSLRYIDAVQIEGEVWFYYECARADGSHELRLNRVKL